MNNTSITCFPSALSPVIILSLKCCVKDLKRDEILTGDYFRVVSSQIVV